MNPNKQELLVATSKVQENGTNFFATIPTTVRSVLKPNKGDELEFVIYNDKTVELRVKPKE